MLAMDWSGLERLLDPHLRSLVLKQMVLETGNVPRYKVEKLWSDHPDQQQEQQQPDNNPRLMFPVGDRY
jgi:hypothetical protein